VTKSNPFYKMLDNLFQTSQLVLYGRIDNVSEEQQLEVIKLLENQYKNESVGYPNPGIEFHRDAARWSSTILFYAAQLVMYREHSSDLLINLFPNFGRPKSASAIITSDLCLRYIPSILKYLEQIDIEDELIPILKKLLLEWHYTGLLSDISLDVKDIQTVLNDSCLSQLYINRIIEMKKKEVGRMKELEPLVLSALGNYRNEFWKDFKLSI